MSQTCMSVSPEMILWPAALVSCGNPDQKYYMQSDTVTVGRKDGALITIENPVISRCHLIIQRRGVKFTICDTSTHGTFVNGRRLEKNHITYLQHRDKICLSNLSEFSYTFMINHNLKAAMEQSEALSHDYEKKIISLDTTHSDDMNKITKQIYDFESEKMRLHVDLRSKLAAQDALFQEEKRKSLEDQNSKDMLKEIEEKIKKSEQAVKEEQEKLLEENEMKVRIIALKEKELLQMKTNLSVQYQEERRALEEKFNLEATELKERLKESMVEQNRMKVEQERMKAETFQAEQTLSDTRKNLLASEMEQFRLTEEKIALQDYVADLTQANSANDLKVKMLEEKLQEKEETENKMKKEMEGLEDDMMCSICAELFMEPTVVNCGHTFCKKCINDWQKKKKICPMCRAKISSSYRVFAMDAIIEKSVVLLSEEARLRREATILERKGGHKSIPAKKRKTHRNSSIPMNMVNYGEFPLPLIPATTHPRLPTGMLVGTSTSTGMFPTYSLPGPSTSIGPLPSTSGLVSNQDVFTDPFTWSSHSRTRNRSQKPPETVTLSSSPVTVAAIDLTHLPTPTPLNHHPSTATATATSTSTSSSSNLNQTIDLTDL